MKSLVFIVSLLFFIGCGGSSSSPTTSDNNENTDDTQTEQENTQTFTPSPYFRKLGDNGVELDDNVQTWKITELIEDGIMIEAKTVTSYARELEFKEAKAYCDTLDYAGFDDWRLPNEDELRFILNVASNSTTEMQYFPYYFSDYYSSPYGASLFSYLRAIDSEDENLSTRLRIIISSSNTTANIDENSYYKASKFYCIRK